MPEVFMSNYSIILQWSKEDEGYIAIVPELPGVSAFGKKPEDAIREVKDAIKACVESLKEDNQEIPNSRALEEYSGEFRLRTPKALHRELSQLAKIEGISLNSYVIYMLSKVLEIEKVEKNLQKTMSFFSQEVINRDLLRKNNDSDNKSIPAENKDNIKLNSNATMKILPFDKRKTAGGYL